MMVPIGLASLTFLNSSNTTIQLSVEPAYRGRVIALYMVVVQGGTPIGAPLVGWLGNTFGARWSVGSGAIISLVAALVAVVIVLHQRHRKSRTPAELRRRGTGWFPPWATRGRRVTRWPRGRPGPWWCWPGAPR